LHKIAALYINEWLKISKKVSVIVMLAIMVVGVMGFGGLIKMEEETFGYQGPDGQDDAWVYEQMNETIRMINEELIDIETRLAAATGMEKANLEEQKALMLDQIAMYQLAIDEKIPLLTGSDYRSQALNTALALKPALRALTIIPEASRTAEQQAQILQYAGQIASYEDLAANQDFRSYLDIENARIDADQTMADDLKKIAKESNELWYKLDPTGGVSGEDEDGSMRLALSQVEDLKKSLLYNLDYTNEGGSLVPLTSAGRQEIENKLAVTLYRLEKGLSTSEYNLAPQEIAIQGMFGFGIFMIIILMMILAGGSISQEIATGSIKSLIISPTRRWKIFTAKVLSLLSVGLAAVLVLYVLVMLINGVLFGFSSGSPYVFAINGKAGELGFYAYRLGQILVRFIDVIVYMGLALMLSVITRNTAAAVGISIAIYFGGSIANSFLSLFAKGEWLKFIPFNNLGLTSDFFPYDTFTQTTGGLFGLSGGSTSPSILFSLVYLIVLMACMGYTALDSFNRRDIK